MISTYVSMASPTTYVFSVLNYFSAVISSCPQPFSSWSQRTILYQWLHSLHGLCFMNSLACCLSSWPLLHPSPSVFWPRQCLWPTGLNRSWWSFSLSFSIVPHLSVFTLLCRSIMLIILIASLCISFTLVAHSSLFFLLTFWSYFSSSLFSFFSTIV